MLNNVIYIESLSSEDVCRGCDGVIVVSLTEDGAEYHLECDCGSTFLVA